jgi:hypothetical protein
MTPTPTTTATSSSARDERATELHHDFAFEPEYRLAGRMLGIGPDTCSVVVDDRYLRVHFGPWAVATRLENVAGASVTGPYQRLKTLGPPHLSLADRGLTFATNHHEGVCVRLVHAVRGIEPLGLIRHPAVTVTVEDPAGLASLLSEVAAARAPETSTLVEELHDDLFGLTASELRRRVRRLGVSGTARMSKAELIELLDPATRQPARADRRRG